MKGRLARAIVTLERKRAVPSTLNEFEQLVTDTYRIKPAGQRAFDQFKTARQQKRTPRAYLLQLEDWAAIVNQDSTMERITDEQIFFKFKTSLWNNIQDEIVEIIRKDKCDGKNRDLSRITKYLELVEYIYDRLIKQSADDRPSPRCASRG